MYTRQQIEDNIILLNLSGSRAYGTHTFESDYDWRGIMVRPNRDDYLRYEGFEQKDSGWEDEPGKLLYLSADTVIWDLKKYLQLANKSNPNIMEHLWGDNYKVLEPIGKKLIADREMFISKNVIGTYKGYAYSQLRKLANKNNTEQLKRLSDKKAGYRCKHAMHCLRLLYQLHYLFLHGVLHVKVDNFSKKQATFLREIKNGDVPLDRVKAACEDYMTLINELDFSDFPKPLTQQKLSDYFIQLLDIYYEK